MCHEAALRTAPGPSITRRVQEHHCQDMRMSLLGHRNVTARMSSSEDMVCAPAHPNASRSLAALRPFRSGCRWDVHDLQQSHLQSLASERSVKPGQLLHAGRVTGQPGGRQEPEALVDPQEKQQCHRKRLHMGVWWVSPHPHGAAILLGTNFQIPTDASAPNALQSLDGLRRIPPLSSQKDKRPQRISPHSA